MAKQMNITGDETRGFEVMISDPTTTEKSKNLGKFKTMADAQAAAQKEIGGVSPKIARVVTLQGDAQRGFELIVDGKLLGKFKGYSELLDTVTKIMKEGDIQFDIVEASVKQANLCEMCGDPCEGRYCKDCDADLEVNGPHDKPDFNKEPHDQGHFYKIQSCQFCGAKTADINCCIECARDVSEINSENKTSTRSCVFCGEPAIGSQYCPDCQNDMYAVHEGGNDSNLNREHKPYEGESNMNIGTASNTEHQELMGNTTFPRSKPVYAPERMFAAKEKCESCKTSIRNARNFWVEMDIDGRSAVATGPRNFTGGYHIVLMQRKEGQPGKIGYVEGKVLQDGTLMTEVELDGKKLNFTTMR